MRPARVRRRSSAGGAHFFFCSGGRRERGSGFRRAGAGSGTSIADVNKLLKGFDQMQSVMKMLGGGKGTKGVRGKARMLNQLRNIDTSQLPL